MYVKAGVKDVFNIFLKHECQVQHICVWAMNSVYRDGHARKQALKMNYEVVIIGCYYLLCCSYCVQHYYYYLMLCYHCSE